jgi:hypothetical protein
MGRSASGNEANLKVGCGMQQARKPVGGENRRGGERPRGRNETSQVAARRRRAGSHSTNHSGVDTDRTDDGGAHRGARRREGFGRNGAVAQPKPMSGGSVEGQSTQTTSKTSKVRVKSRVVETQGPSCIRAVSRPRGEAASWGGHGRTFFGTDGPDGEGILEGHSGNGARPRRVSRKGSRPATEPPTPDKIAGSGQRLVVSSKDAQRQGRSAGSGTRRL